MAEEHVLINDDDPTVQRLLEKVMTSNQLIPSVVGSGEAALDQVRTHTFDLILLDINMGGIDGFHFLEAIRQRNISTPVIIVSGRNEDYDTLYGLELGADDYITKPFNPLELTARVKSVLRRYTQLGAIAEKKNHIFRIGSLVVDDDGKEVTVEGEPVKLTPIEYRILLLLVKNPGKVFSIGQIYESIWNEDAISGDNTVAVHIRHIREKIEINSKEPRYLKVVWGVGYKIDRE